MSKVVKLVQSPFNPPVEIAEDIVLKLYVPYSESSVTIMVNPNIQEYLVDIDNDTVKVRQVMVSTETEDTRILCFDLTNNSREVEIGSKNYLIKLLNIGKKAEDGQDFIFYEFFIEKL